jgi:hypothetical protein
LVFTVPVVFLHIIAPCRAAAVLNAVTAEPLKVPLIGIWGIVPFLSGILLQGCGLIGSEPRGSLINLSCQFLNIEFIRAATALAGCGIGCFVQFCDITHEEYSG